MRTIRLEIELEYDDRTMHGYDEEAREWFFKQVLGLNQLGPEDSLILHSNFIGDSLGFVRVVRVVEGEL